MAIWHTLASQGKAVNFLLQISGAFSFSFDSKQKVLAQKARKVSPSTKKWNDLRRQKFLASKKNLLKKKKL